MVEEPSTSSSGSNPFADYKERELLGHKRRCTTLGWSADGRKLASGSADASIRVWTVDPTSQPSKTEKSDAELKGHMGAPGHLAWQPGNAANLLVSTTSGDKSDKSTRLWDARTGKCTAVTNAPGIWVTWCPDGSSYAVVNSDNTFSICDMRKAGKVVKQHKFATQVYGEIYEAMWGPAMNQLTLSTGLGSLNVVTLPHMEPLWSLKGHTASCYTFATNKMQKYIATGGADALVNLWELDGLVCTRTWCHMDHNVRSLSMSCDSSYLAYATEGGELELLSTQSGDRLAEIKLKSQFCDAVAWNPRSNVLAYTDEVPDPATRDRSMVGVVGIYAPPPSK